jgi:hypothetical protein
MKLISYYSCKSDFLAPARPSTKAYFYCTWISCTVEDPGCLSWIPDPDFCPSRIQDPKTDTKERGEKKLLPYLFYVTTKITNMKIILILHWWRKRFGPIYKEL